MLKNFLIPGKASFILGGQFGSEAKGAAAAWVGTQVDFDILTTNASAQAGHTSIHDGKKRVVFHLPSAQFGLSPALHRPIGYLNAGAAIDINVLRQELAEYGRAFSEFYIHPNAAIITEGCKVAENRADSAQTRIASTRKGVGEALARKVLRSGDTAAGLLNTKRLDLCREMLHGSPRGKSVLVEVPQGIGLSLNGPFYPYCTSRDCTVMQAASDAQIHPSFVGPVMLVLRTFPIRVGNITRSLEEGALYDEDHKGKWTLGTSGGCYPDQHETSWEKLGVPSEITTVTKRVRRVFTWSHRQVVDAFISARPTHVFLSHVDYLRGNVEIELRTYILLLQTAAMEVGIPVPQIFYSTGPTTADVREWEG